MDRDRQSELVSAYLDGEVSAGERTETERLLEGSSELREELNDFARLSDLLRGLPRESAPVELAAAIRQAAERKLLLGPEPTAPRRSYLREIVVAITAMAATVLAMLWLPTELQQPQGSIANSTASTPQVGPVIADGTQPAEQVLVAKSDETSFPAPMAMRSAAPPAPPPVAAGAAMEHDPEVAAKLNETALAGRGLNEQELDALHIGEALPYVERDANGVAVAEFLVVDVEEAGNRLEVLLRRNGLDVLPEESQTLRDGEERAEKAKSRKAAADPQLMMVYVDAPRETISQVLEEMARERLFSQARLQPPVDVSELALKTPLPNAVSVADKSPSSDTDRANQTVVNEAAEVASNVRGRQMQMKKGEMTLTDANRGAALAKDGQKRTPDLPKSMAMKQARSSLAELLMDLPADALQIANAPGEVQPVQRRQNVAVTVLENRLEESPREAFGGAAKPQAMRAAKELKAGAAADLAVESERAAADVGEPTIRFLFVLQSRDALPTP